MELHKMTKELALRPQYAQYPNPNPKPELFGKTRPKVKKPYSSWPVPQVHFKEGQAGGGGAGVRVRYTEEQLGFGAGILSFHAGGLVLPFRWFECGNQQLWYVPSK